MKKLLRALGLALGLSMGLCAPAHAQSIDSKIEQAGKMTYVKVSSLKSVVRDGLLTLQMELSNESTGQQSVTWRVRWLDADGFTVGGDEPWKPELLHGKQRRSIQTVAPSRKVRDFKIELHSPDNDGGYGTEPGPQP